MFLDSVGLVGELRMYISTMFLRQLALRPVLSFPKITAVLPHLAPSSQCLPWVKILFSHSEVTRLGFMSLFSHEMWMQECEPKASMHFCHVSFPCQETSTSQTQAAQPAGFCYEEQMNLSCIWPWWTRHMGNKQNIVARSNKDLEIAC
jgi:hypothetical protein